MKIRSATIGLACIVGVTAAVVGCGSDDDDGGSGSNVAVGGNLASAPVASVASEERSFLARAVDELTTFVREAYAQATGLEEVQVTVGGGTDLTDEAGNFDIDGIPSGDLLVRFERGNCNASVSLPEVSEGAVVILEDVDFQCQSAAPARIVEAFEAVVRNKPGSPNGNLNVCIESAGTFRTRVVKIQGAAFEGGTFDDLAVQDRVAVNGLREGVGAPSALQADVVTLLGPAGGDPCAGDVLPTETPDPAETPEGTPTETPEMTPTETPEATPTETPEP